MHDTHKKIPLDEATSKGQELENTTTQKGISVSNHNIERLKRLPKELRIYPNWLVRKGKVPYSPITHTQGNGINACGTFTQALYALQSGEYDGLGFHFDNTPFTGIDLDHHIESGVFDEMAMQIFLDCHSYTEYSPSGMGVHIIVKGKTPKAVKNSPIGFEMYSQGRYFTITGNAVQGSPSTIEYRQNTIQTLYETFAMHEIQESNVYRIGGISLTPVYSTSELMQVVNRIQNSTQKDKFNRLYLHGDVSSYNGDTSSADAGLLSILEYWTHGNAQMMHDIFCLSKLAERDKWQHGNTGHNPMYYRVLTIRRVIARQNYIRKQEDAKVWEEFKSSFFS